MKFILFKVCDELEKKFEIKDIKISDNKQITELQINKKNLDKRLAEDDNRIFGKIKNKSYDKKFRKVIYKALENEKNRWYFALDINTLSNKKLKSYLTIKLQELLGYQVVVCIDKNTCILKHIENHSSKTSILPHDMKALIIHLEQDNIDINILKKIVEKCKTVNIFSKSNVSKGIMTKIEKINKELGCSIEIINSAKKAFKDYDVIIFLDCYKRELPRLRLNEKSLIIDKGDFDEDIFSSYVIKLNEEINKGQIDDKIAQKLCKDYGKLVSAEIIVKIIE